MKVLFVYEYGTRPDDSMMSDLIEALHVRHPEMVSRYLHGFQKKYTAGGTHPLRILNLLYMYARLPFELFMFRPALLFVRTTPPCIQLWAAVLAALFGSRVGCWLMDYHPEIELRMIERRRGLQWLATVVRKVDKLLMQRMSFIVVLDEAMKALVRERCPILPLIQHPTWGQKSKITYESGPRVKVTKDGEISLIYAGNLGVSHPLDTLESLIVELSRRVRVRLIAVGASASGEARLRRVSARHHIELQLLNRLPFQQLGLLFHEMKVHVGVVLLANETAGLVSPSKFAAYIRFGIPILYIGPTGTSSETVCTRFGAGFALRNEASVVELRATAKRMCSNSELVRVRTLVRKAADYFGTRNGRTLTEALDRVWVSDVKN